MRPLNTGLTVYCTVCLSGSESAQVFVIYCLYVLTLKFQLSKVDGWHLIPLNIRAGSKLRPGIPTSYGVVFLRGGVVGYARGYS